MNQEVSLEIGASEMRIGNGRTTEMDSFWNTTRQTLEEIHGIWIVSDTTTEQKPGGLMLLISGVPYLFIQGCGVKDNHIARRSCKTLEFCGCLPVVEPYGNIVCGSLEDSSAKAFLMVA